MQTDQDIRGQVNVSGGQYEESEQSIMESDSEGEDVGEYMDDEDDGSSSLSIPNESIDFDLVYSLHSFAATVEGQANVVKGDSLFLMDDSNSYWWLVRVLKTQEVGYIPAENIETPFERLARLNKHRNVDLASATQAELQEGLHATQDRLRSNFSPRIGNGTPSPARNGQPVRRGVTFIPNLYVHRYPPAVWHEEDEEDEDVEWDLEPYEDEDPGLAEEQMMKQRMYEEMGPNSMEFDDGVRWDDPTADARQVRAAAQTRDQQQQQQQEQQQKSAQQGQPIAQQGQETLQQQQPQIIRTSPSREKLQQETLASPKAFDPAEATETRKLTVTPSIAREAELTSTSPPKTHVLSPSVILQQQQQQQKQKQAEEERSKRLREEEEEATRKRAKGSTPTGERKMAAPVSSASIQQQQQQQAQAAQQAQTQRAGKLRKEPSRDSGSADDETGSSSSKEGKKKKSSVFGRLFGGKDKEKNKDKNSSTSSLEGIRPSDDSGRLRDLNDISPTTAQAMQQQNIGMASRNSLDPRRSNNSDAAQDSPQSASGGSPVSQQQKGGQAGNTTPPEFSQTASQLLQRDQQQQARYQQYLSRSPASSPETKPSYGLQSALAVGVQSYASPMRLDTSVAGTSPASGNNNNGNSTQLLSPTSASGLGPPSTPRQRPGSLLLTPASLDGIGIGISAGPGVPELSVIRVFAGENLDTEATFKTVLLNSSTTSGDLIRQAIQRFRLSIDDASDHTAPHAADPRSHSTRAIRDETGAEYYLTAKQVELGGTIELAPHEEPLIIFEKLVEAALEMPKVKRSSVGSISSVASNLSMHPAIRKLPMNDFTDDSTVKFYLNRRLLDGAGRSKNGDSTTGAADEESGAARSAWQSGDGVATTEDDEEAGGSYGRYDDEDGEDGRHASAHADSRGADGQKGTHLTVNSTLANSGGSASSLQERFMSPSFKFALQLVITAGDLPDDMMFHPTTEAIVFKSELPKIYPSPAAAAGAAGASGVSQTARKKVFMFPKNATVGEVIESGLERFGILEGVVDGGDEVEDKLSKRRSSMRVRYCLKADIGNGQERELSPSTRVIDAFPKPPHLKASSAPLSKRRSMDSAHLLGSPEDVQPDDPVFLLRRAATYRIANKGANRISAALDDVALLRHARDREGGQVYDGQHQHHPSHHHHHQERHAHQQQQQLQHRTSSSLSGSTGAAPSASANANSTGSTNTPSPNSGATRSSPSPSAHSSASAADDARIKRQEILAQRNAVRAGQRSALLSAQHNSVRGMDVLLPNNALLRSSRYELADGRGDGMRYSYVQPDGETWDISEIVEEEWRSGVLGGSVSPFGAQGSGAGAGAGGGLAQGQGKKDLLEGLARGPAGNVEEKLERVLNRVNKEGRKLQAVGQQQQQQPAQQRQRQQQHQQQSSKIIDQASLRSFSPASQYSNNDSANEAAGAYGSRSRSAEGVHARAGSTSGATSATPTAKSVALPEYMGHAGRHPSIASVISEASDYGSNATGSYAPSPMENTFASRGVGGGQQATPSQKQQQQQQQQHRPEARVGNGNSISRGATNPPSGPGARPKFLPIPADNFNVQHMMAVIEYKASYAASSSSSASSSNGNAGAGTPRGMVPIVGAAGSSRMAPLEPADEMLFGRSVELDDLHPGVKDIYADGFRQVAEMDKLLDDFLMQAQAHATKA